MARNLCPKTPQKPSKTDLETVIIGPELPLETSRACFSRLRADYEGGGEVLFLADAGCEGFEMVRGIPISPRSIASAVKSGGACA
jgi:hypothetical protein